MERGWRGKCGVLLWLGGLCMVRRSSPEADGAKIFCGPVTWLYVKHEGAGGCPAFSLGRKAA